MVSTLVGQYCQVEIFLNYETQRSPILKSLLSYWGDQSLTLLTS